MPFVYDNPLALVGKPVVGTGPFKGECAAIAQSLVRGLGDNHVAQWRRGAKVKGQVGLRPGTVIAIFDTNGRYIGTTTHRQARGVSTAPMSVTPTSP